MTFSDSVPYFYLEAAKGWQQRDRCERDIRVWKDGVCALGEVLEVLLLWKKSTPSWKTNYLETSAFCSLVLIKNAVLASLQYDTPKQEYGLLLHLRPVGLRGDGGDILSYGWVFSFHVPSVLGWQSAIITSVVSTLQFLTSRDYTQIHKFIPCKPLLTGWWLLVSAGLDLDSHGKAREEMPISWSSQCQDGVL